LQKPKPFLSLSILLKLIITAGAYIYIYYRINSSLSQSHGFNLFLLLTPEKLIILLSVIILMGINWLIESLKWQKLLITIEKISINKSIKSVLVGITCSIFTPYRIGEYFGRPMLIAKQKRIKAIAANFISSISQNIVTFGLGVAGTVLLLLNRTQNLLTTKSRIIILVALISLCLLLLLFYFSPKLLVKVIKAIHPLSKLIKKFDFLEKYSKKELLNILLLSFSRYLVFFSQYYLLLLFFNVNIGLIDSFTAISLSYVFLFSIPGIPIADIGIRGSLALFFLGLYSSNDIAILSASSALWVINLAIPSIVGSYFLIKNKIVGS